MPNLLQSFVYFQADLCSETGDVKIPGQGAVRRLRVSRKNQECPETVGTPPSCLGKRMYFMEGLQVLVPIIQGGQQGGTSREIRKQGEYVESEATTALLQFLSWI